MSFIKIFSKTPKVDKDIPETESIFETYKGKIYPWIKVTFSDDDPRNTPTRLTLTGDESPINKVWQGDLSIFYVADTGDSFQVLLERNLPQNFSKEQLHNIAIDNLTKDIEFKLHETNFGGHGLIAGGDHEAGSLCLPEMWDWLTEHLDDSLIVGVPAKDLVIMVPESDTEKVANLKIFVHEIFKEGERLLTRNIFRFDRETKEWTIVDSVS